MAGEPILGAVSSPTLQRIRSPASAFYTLLAAYFCDEVVTTLEKFDQLKNSVR